MRAFHERVPIGSEITWVTHGKSVVRVRSFRHRAFRYAHGCRLQFRDVLRRDMVWPILVGTQEVADVSGLDMSRMRQR